MPTIFAPATPAGKSALQILRISGPATQDIMGVLAPKLKFLPQIAKLTRLYDTKKRLLDEALVLPFKQPKSFTGEDSVELYLHGSPAVLRAVQNAIVDTKLARMAEPGEFTKRAFRNNRLDLAQVEGIRDLLSAETEQQRQTSVLGAVGVYTKQFETWRSKLVYSSGMLAAEIDFAEDNGFEENENALIKRVKMDVSGIKHEMEEAVEQNTQCSELVKHGLKVALLGVPNAGKSSLTNHVVQRSACIVSDIPGTTRDVLEIGLEVGGHKVVLYDTAGVHESKDEIEKLGIEKALETAKQADLIIALDPEGLGKDLKEEISALEQCNKTVIRVTSKCDINTISNGWGLPISSKTGEGIDKLLNLISSHCDKQVGFNNNESVGIGMSTRARALLETEAIPGLEACIELLDTDVVLSNAELQRAVSAIGAITGTSVSTEEVLGIVFGEFCIGK